MSNSVQKKNAKTPTAAQRKAQSQRDKAIYNASKARGPRFREGPQQQIVGPSRPLGLKAHVGTKNKTNTYLASILDPWNVPGARIPDLISLPSIPVQCFGRFSMAADAQGNVGVAITVGNTGTTLANQALTATGATPGAYTWSAMTNGKYYDAQMRSVFQASRIVSAGLCVRLDAAFTQDQGRFYCVFLPASTGYQNVAVGAAALNAACGTAQALQAQPFSETVPASNRYAEVKYVPLDISDTEYAGTQDTGETSGVILIAGFGLAAGAPLDFEWVENYEAIPNVAVGQAMNATNQPQTGMMMPEAKPSPVSLSALQHAANVIGKDPHIAVRQNPQDTALASPIHKPRSGVSHGTFLDPWIDTFKKGAGVVKDLASVAMPFLPFLL